MRVRLIELGEVAAGVAQTVLKALPAPWIRGGVERVAPDPRATPAPGAQLDAMEAIASLPLPDPGGVVLGVTPYDLAFPPLAYVVGLSPLGERLGVVSYGRLSPPDHPLGAPPAALALQRLVTAAVHELGHSSGLVHCAVPHCVMHASSAPDHLDLKQPTYCPACDDQLHEASCTADSAEPSGPRRDRQARERA